MKCTVFLLIAAIVATAFAIPAFPAGTEQFSCKAAGQQFSSSAFPIFQVAKGSTEYVTSQRDDMLCFVRTEPTGEKAWSSVRVEGSHQMIEDLQPADPLSLIVSLGAEIPTMPGKFFHVYVAVKGVSKTMLSKLPLTIAVAARGQGKGVHASISAQYAGGTYEGKTGEVILEAVDFKARTMRGRFSADLKNPGYGTAPAGPAVKIEAGQFNLLERK